MLHPFTATYEVAQIGAYFDGNSKWPLKFRVFWRKYTELSRDFFFRYFEKSIERAELLDIISNIKLIHYILNWYVVSGANYSISYLC